MSRPALLAVVVLLGALFVTPVCRADDVTALYLVDAVNDVDLFPVTDGMVIDVSMLMTTQLNMRAETDPFPTGSVVFDLDGQTNFNTEGAAPYALDGDTAGDFNAWSLGLGTHTVTATAYTGGGGSGTAGPPLTITFELVDTTPPGMGPSVLILTETQGFTHANQISAGLTMFNDLAAANGFQMTHAPDSAGVITNTNLAQFDAVVFLNTTGNIFNSAEEAAFENYIAGGGGYVGIHSATDCEYGWAYYGDFVGTWFSNHPPGVNPATLNVADATHPSTLTLAPSFVWADEWYNFQSNVANDADTNLLLLVDETTYSGGTMGPVHPISWNKTVNGGRMFYTALGHNVSAYTTPFFREHVLGGLQWAIGTTSPPPTGPDFIRGDVDQDGNFDIADAITTLNHLFVFPIDCSDIADLDDSGTVSLTDVILGLNFIFGGGAVPAAPYPGCGPDPTPSAGCAGVHAQCP